jgi:hypothetical protein
MTREFTEAELESYLDEALSPSDMAEIEELLRQRPELTEQLKAIHGRRDAGIHTLGEIWRRHRISCPDRELLGSYLLGVLESAQQAHIQFHLETIGCRLCNANLEDLQARQQEAERATHERRRRYFQSSAGYLHGDE